MALSALDRTLNIIPRHLRPVVVRAAIAVAVVCAVAVAAGAAYSSHRDRQAAEINALYWQLQQAIEEGELEQAGTVLAKIEGYGQELPTGMAKLVLAHALYQEGDYEDALALYEDVAAESSTPTMRDTGMVRIAKTQVALGMLEEALLTAQSLSSSSPYFAIVAGSLTGDIHLASDALDEATVAYRSVIEQAEEAGDERLAQLLRTKLAVVMTRRLQLGIPLPRSERAAAEPTPGTGSTTSVTAPATAPATVLPPTSTVGQ